MFEPVKDDVFPATTHGGRFDNDLLNFMNNHSIKTAVHRCSTPSNAANDASVIKEGFKRLGYKLNKDVRVAQRRECVYMQKI